MRDQIIANEIPKFIAYNWMTSLAFIQRPDEITLETFYTILEFSRKKIDPEYTLGATAVIHTFCRQNANCKANTHVQRIVNLLETEFLNLFNMYRNERRTKERMIVILKGLSNIGIMSEPFAAQLQDTISNDVMPMDIRLQSILAFRRNDCKLYQNFFLDIYANYTVNSEIRMLSYLQAIQCPDYISINRIKNILTNEKINQVGSFVWSHLRNLGKSSSPTHIAIQGFLMNNDFGEKFKLDFRTFSRNFEYSVFFDEYNFGKFGKFLLENNLEISTMKHCLILGATTDFNLMFGTNSYLPRMAALNFTTELFGQSVNFLDFSIRAEGFEDLISSLFGYRGPFNRNYLKKYLSIFGNWFDNDESDYLGMFFISSSKKQKCIVLQPLPSIYFLCYRSYG